MKRILLLVVASLLSAATYSQIKLPRLMSHGAVLQREVPITLWGWASPGEQVVVDFNQKQYRTVTDQAGKWQVPLPPQPAGGPYDLTFTGSNQIQLRDVLFGDVWLCSGQSNMEIPMSRVEDTYAALIARINNPNIRQFEVPDRYNFEKPEADFPAGEWRPATPEHILRFGAVGYFFANELYEKYQVPIGLINAAVGGSPAEAWISEATLKKFPTYYQEAQRFKDRNLIRQIETEDKRRSDAWYARLNQTDQGLKNKWAAPQLDDTAWPTMQLPGYWADQVPESTQGVVWFRKQVTISAQALGQPAKLLLGRIVDADSAFINGTFVGTTSYQYPPRKYKVPPGLLQEGLNTIAVRVINSAGKGGFVPDKPYGLVIGKDTLDLQGTWKYQVGTRMDPLAAPTFVRWKPLGLFNAMIAPLTSYPVKGVLWYQGESNAERPADYADLLTTLIADWRQHWQRSDLPFIGVQLANYLEPQPEPSESTWAELRQAQRAALSAPNTGLAVAIDLGEWNDIHPLNKQDVGRRLALQARRLAYGDRQVVASGPLYASVQRRGNKLTVAFSEVGGGLRAVDGQALRYFAVAGKDKKFVWASAEIKGPRVVVWSDQVPDPYYVRYAWADNPAGANLYNREQLPASPFEASIQTKR
ncbi:sialate O-acetylesterase [Rhabdobacter roseus]|uniref:Sialate O-acetylesterase n=1 Tax=Rhabdobacter roseus TaxID=1655419 RepID=A0A840TPL8_9BACT|nr:sialate O-acetylesterase [Rhabdobacter roseus]MBB5285294.1 sialate O-acetylesterase [Rhabdobacter roseus]